MKLNANKYLNEFKGKFIPFNLDIKKGEHRIIGPIKKGDPDISVDIVNSPVPLKKGPVRYRFSPGEKLVETAFEVLTSDNKKIAYVDLRLTFSGEIVFQNIAHYATDNSIFIHSKHTDKHTRIPYESFTFKKGNEKDYENFEITQVENKVIGAMYSSRSQNRNPSTPFSKTLSSSLFTRANFIGDYLETPYKYQGKDGILLQYQAYKAKFLKHIGLDLNCSENEFQRALESQRKIFQITKTDQSISKIYTSSPFKDVVSYLINKKNNIISSFGGNYIGSIFKDTLYTTEDNTIGNSQPLAIVTEQKKDGNTYRCYNLLENQDIDTIRKLNEELKKDRKKGLKIDPKKGPNYVTILGENGEEELFLYNGQRVSKLTSKEMAEAQSNYASFVEEFIAPFSGIQPIKIEQFMQQKDQSLESR